MKSQLQAGNGKIHMVATNLARLLARADDYSARNDKSACVQIIRAIYRELDENGGNFVAPGQIRKKG